jgi:hypothetical protein
VKSFSDSPLGFESYLVSQASLVDKKTIPMQYLIDTTLVLGGYASLDHVVSHPVQPTVVEMQSSANTTLFWVVMHLLTMLSCIMFNQWSC